MEGGEGGNTREVSLRASFLGLWNIYLLVVGKEIRYQGGKNIAPLFYSLLGSRS